MTEWTPKAGEDAVVRVRAVSSGGEVAWLEGGGSSPISALRPLPTALSAEDALREPSDREVARAWETWTRTLGSPSDFMGAALRDFLARRRSTPPAAVAAFKAGDRVRRKSDGRAGVIGSRHNSREWWVEWAGGGAGIVLETMFEPDPEPATPRDTTALRDAVLAAVKVYREKRKEYRMNPTAAGDGAISNARRALDTAHAAIRARDAKEASGG